jgi:hypothetical protein
MDYPNYFLLYLFVVVPLYHMLLHIKPHSHGGRLRSFQLSIINVITIYGISSTIMSYWGEASLSYQVVHVNKYHRSFKHKHAPTLPTYVRNNIPARTARCLLNNQKWNAGGMKMVNLGVSR